MTKEEQIVKNLQIEIEALRKTPVYQAYVKFKQEYAEGQEVEQIIMSKMKRFNMMLGQIKQQQEALQNPEETEVDDEVDTEEELPPVKVMPQKQQVQLKQNLQKNRTVSPQREEQLNKKVAEVVNPFEAEADELGLNDDIPGLPDSLED